MITRIVPATIITMNLMKLNRICLDRFVSHIVFTTLLKASTRENANTTEMRVPTTPAELPPVKSE